MEKDELKELILTEWSHGNVVFTRQGELRVVPFSTWGRRPLDQVLAACELRLSDVLNNIDEKNVSLFTLFQLLWYYRDRAKELEALIRGE